MLKRLLSRTLLPLSVAGSLGALLVARAAGGPLEAVVLAASVAVLGIGVVLERLMPFRRAWNLSHGDTATDLTSAALLLGAVDPLLKAFVPVLAVAMTCATAG